MAQPSSEFHPLPTIPADKIEAATRCLKVLAHPARLSILCALYDGAKNVQQLEKQIGISQSNMSQHLGALKDRGILVSRREGTQVFYQVADPRMFQLLGILQTLFCGDDPI